MPALKAFSMIPLSSTPILVYNVLLHKGVGASS